MTSLTQRSSVPIRRSDWREDVRDFFVAYLAGLVAFGVMLA